MTESGVYVKDLRVINRNLHDMVLIDNAAYSYAFQLENGVPILSIMKAKISNSKHSSVTWTSSPRARMSGSSIVTPSNCTTTPSSIRQKNLSSSFTWTIDIALRWSFAQCCEVYALVGPYRGAARDMAVGGLLNCL